MTSLTYDEIFEAAAQIMLFIDRSITINFTLGAVRIRFPTTRKLAEHLQMPHYYVLPYFATMEKEDMIIRVERVGISTTKQGSRKLIELITSKYKKETEAILGASLFNELQQRVIEKTEQSANS
jgi:DNA-binding transcriptional regulator YhcF (GntR family)